MEIVEVDVNVISEIITIEPSNDREWPTPAPLQFSLVYFCLIFLNKSVSALIFV
jgi:hypothetical protein